MSQSQQFPVSDPYLASSTGGMWIPENDLVVDPQYGNIKMITTIGRFANLNIVRPQQFKNQDGSLGAPTFSATILLNPNACGDLYRAIVAVAAHRFPPETKPDPQNPQVLRPYSAEELLFLDEKLGGLHYPLRAGSDSYMRDPVKYEQWRELFFINASMYANDTRGNPQRPIYYDERGQLCDPSMFYRGCYGLMNVTIFSYPKAGTQGARSRGVGIGLNAVRFARHGEKLGTFDAAKAASTAFARAGSIPVAEPPPVGFGPNTGTPGSVPPGVAPGVAMPGFAAPPSPNQPQQAPMQYGTVEQQPQQPVYQTQPQQAPVYQPPLQQPGYQQAPPQGLPPQMPQHAYAPAGVRPPG